MFSSIRSRVIVIVLLVVGSIYFLFPRTVTLRERGDNGVMRGWEGTPWDRRRTKTSP